MAKNQRRAARNTRTGSNAMGIQRAINKDYAVLGRDYGKLFVELWRMPYTRYVLGGVAIAAVVPAIISAFGGTAAVGTAVTDNFDRLKTRFSDLTSSAENSIASEY